MKQEKYSNGIIFHQQIKDKQFQSGLKREMFNSIYMDTHVEMSKYLHQNKKLKNKMF